VLVLSPDHRRSLADLDSLQVVEVLTVMRDRARFHATTGPTAMDDRAGLGDESLSARPWTIVALLY
jgi:hypothetical protein